LLKEVQVENTQKSISEFDGYTTFGRGYLGLAFAV